MHQDWQKAFFRGVALDAWRQITTDEMTRREAEFLEKTLHLLAGACVLDVPCGNGRHSAFLSSRGYAMTGIDQSEEFIEEARGRVPDSVHWIQGDMLSLPCARGFDAGFCWGNSFCYLNRDGVGRFLRAVVRSLKPRARFAVDTGMAAESILPSLARSRWFRVGEILMLSENQYDPIESRLDIEYTFVRDAQVETRPTTSYVFTSGELCRMHEDAGLSPVELFGSVDGDNYHVGSPRLILVSQVRL